jgi:hypothetical protein
MDPILAFAKNSGALMFLIFIDESMFAGLLEEPNSLYCFSWTMASDSDYDWH